MTAIPEQVYLKCSIQRALIGEVTDGLHAVTCSLDGNVIKVIFYYYEEPSPEDIESMQSVTTEVIADFDDAHTIEEEYRVVNSDKPEPLDFWAFMRKRRSG